METPGVDKTVTFAQVLISVIFVVGYFIILTMFMLGYARIPAELRDVFTSLITLLSTGVLSITYFWFQRTRANDQNIKVENNTEVVK
jgi:divalent metal cation (Fe/Co/Zn/Cd) transporter